MPEIIQIRKEEKGLKHMKTKDLVLCAMFVALIAVGAFIKIPVPVVPFTLQFLFTMLAGLLLGPVNGALAVVVYIVFRFNWTFRFSLRAADRDIFSSRVLDISSDLRLRRM